MNIYNIWPCLRERELFIIMQLFSYRFNLPLYIFPDLYLFWPPISLDLYLSYLSCKFQTLCLVQFIYLRTETRTTLGFVCRKTGGVWPESDSLTRQRLRLSGCDVTRMYRPQLCGPILWYAISKFYFCHVSNVASSKQEWQQSRGLSRRNLFCSRSEGQKAISRVHQS
jgi:hypothetical protein